MQINRATDYAVRVMIHLAAMPQGERANRETLASSTQVPAEFLGKVLQTLSRSGLVTSRRGVDGGFELARASESITMLDVVEAMEGKLNLNDCLTAEKQCGRAWWCAAHGVWRQAQTAVRQVLAEASLADLANHSFRRRPAGSLVEFPRAEASWS